MALGLYKERVRLIRREEKESGNVGGLCLHIIFSKYHVRQLEGSLLPLDLSC